MRIYLILCAFLVVIGCVDKVTTEKKYYPNGKLKSEQQFINGKLNGITKEYYANGKILRKAYWVKGTMDSVEYYSNDTINMKIIYGLSGIRKGTFSIWPTGKLREMKNSFVWFARIFKEADTLAIGDSLTTNIVLMVGRLDSTVKCNVIIAKYDTASNRIIEVLQQMQMKMDNTLKYSFVVSQPGKDSIEGEVRVADNPMGTTRRYPFRIVYYVKPR